MTFVVMEECIRCKHTDCVEVCPVDCFYEGPADQQALIALNVDLSVHPAWTRITKQKPAPADHAEWKGVKSKLAQLDRNGA